MPVYCDYCEAVIDRDEERTLLDGNDICIDCLGKKRRSLGADLTDQGRYHLEHGATPDPIVVLNDGETWTPAEGCRLVIPTMEHAAELHNHGMKVNDVQAVAEYNVDALPELVKQLREALQYVAKVGADRPAHGIGLFARRRLNRMNAALDAAIEHEDGAK